MFREVSISNSINSGQVFLWKNENQTWFGINGEDILEVNENKNESDLDEKSREFFRLDDDYKKVLKSISKDSHVKQSVEKYQGLRLLRQDPFQCYISFIVSSNSNIPNIKTRLERLCKKFGKKVKVKENTFHLFPTPKKLANSSQSELLECGLGYRAKFVKAASIQVFERQIDLKSLRKSNYQETRTGLTAIPGIGNKVADCIMLFSLEKLDAFPLDTWILKVLNKYYSEKFSIEGKSLTEKKYETTHNEIVKHFGKYSGYSQQFLFKLIRDQNQKKWL